MKIGFIGAGKVGTALAVVLDAKGYQIGGVYSRKDKDSFRFIERLPHANRYDNPQSLVDALDLIFITTPDDSIEQVAGNVSWSGKKTAVHCSGALSCEVFGLAREQGAGIGCMHPLQTFPGIDEGVARLPGSTFAIDADPDTTVLLLSMAEKLAVRYVLVKPEYKIQYHISCVMVSNYIVSLINTALEMWADFGVDETQAKHALLPILQASVDNSMHMDSAQALTGPIVRGDIQTVASHMGEIEKKYPKIKELYLALAKTTVDIARNRDRSRCRQYEEIRQILDQNNSVDERGSGKT